MWAYNSLRWARWCLRKWCKGAMRSRLKPLKKFVKTMRRHEDLILNWFEAKKQFSSGAVEGMNRKLNLITRKSTRWKAILVHCRSQFVFTASLALASAYVAPFKSGEKWLTAKTAQNPSQACTVMAMAI